MSKHAKTVTLEEMNEPKMDCQNCMKYGHSFDKISVILENNHIRNSRYCICCGMILGH